MKELFKNGRFCFRFIEWCKDFAISLDDDLDLRIQYAMSKNDSDAFFECVGEMIKLLPEHESLEYEDDSPYEETRSRDDIEEPVIMKLLEYAAHAFYVLDYYLVCLDEYDDVNRFSLFGLGGYESWLDKASYCHYLDLCFSWENEDGSDEGVDLLELWEELGFRATPSETETIWWNYCNCGYYSDWDDGEYCGEEGDDSFDEGEIIPDADTTIDASWFWEHPIPDDSLDAKTLWLNLNNFAARKGCPDSRRSRAILNDSWYMPGKYDYSFAHLAKQDYVDYLLAASKNI